MYKRIIILLIMFVVLPYSVDAQTLNLNEKDLKMDISDEFTVFTRDNYVGNPNLNKFGLTEEFMKKVFENDEVYIDAINDKELEFLLFIEEDPYLDINNLSNYEDEYLEDLISDYESVENILSASIYKNNYKYLYLSQYNGSFYSINYYTIVNGRGYKFRIQTIKEIDETEELYLKNIVDSVEFEIDENLKEEIKDKDVEFDLKKYIFSAIRGAIIGVFAYIVVKFCIKKFKLN